MTAPTLRVEAPLDKLRHLRDLQRRAATDPAPRPWRRTARKKQLTVADSTAPLTFYMAGRGTGKTHVGANTLVEWALGEPGYYAIVAPTFGDCQSICVEGKSGLLVAMDTPTGTPNAILARYDKSKFRLYLRNGSVLVMASDEAPARLRGPNYTGAWCDEPGSWRRIRETWDEGVLLATRIGSARKLITGTPKRGNRLVRELYDLAQAGDPDIVFVRERTQDNAANLAPEFLRTVVGKYEGTTLGLQEIEGELLEDVQGALWTRDLLDSTRITDVPQMARVVVGVDPAVTSGENADATGIVVAGRGVDGHVYLLDDLTMRGTPRECLSVAVKAFHTHRADRIIGEVNNGGDYIESVLRTVDEHVPYKSVHASRGKRTRAEPVAALWEQGRAHLVGSFPELEDQCCSWTQDSTESPDALDAAVWAITELTQGATAMTYLSAISAVCPACQMPSPLGATVCMSCGTDLPEAAA